MRGRTSGVDGDADQGLDWACLKCGLGPAVHYDGLLIMKLPMWMSCDSSFNDVVSLSPTVPSAVLHYLAVGSLVRLPVLITNLKNDSLKLVRV